MTLHPCDVTSMDKFSLKHPLSGGGGGSGCLSEVSSQLNGLVGSPPTYMNGLYDWLVLTIKDNEL